MQSCLYVDAVHSQGFRAFMSYIVQGTHIVYQLGGSLYALNVENDSVEEVKFQWCGQGSHKRTHYVEGMDDFEALCLHPDGHSAAMLTRGRVFEMPLWEGPAVQSAFDEHTVVSAVEYLTDNQLLFLARQHRPNAEPSATQVYVQSADFSSAPVRIQLNRNGLEIGQPWELKTSPEHAKQAVVTTSRLQLLFIDLGRRTPEV